MSILDFLFEGKPPQSVTEYGVTTENLPAWYSDYTQGLIARANAIAAEPFQTYDYARLAQLDPYQTKAYKGVEDLGSTIEPGFTSAKGFLETGGAAGALSAASPYLGQAEKLAADFGRATTAGVATPYLTSAEQMARTGAGATAGLATPFMTEAQRMTGAGAGTTLGTASPFLSTAGQTALGAMGQQTAGLAQPYLQSAQQMTAQGAQTVPGMINQYMDPYQQQVVERIGQLGQRQLTENLLPALQAQGIASGQFGGTRSAEAMGRAVRDVGESTLAAQQSALSQGYGQAAQLAQADAARQLQAAQQQAAFGTTAAGLASQDIARQLGAAQQLGGVGTQLAGIESQDLQRQLAAAQQMGALGTATAGMSAADLQRQLAASQQLGVLGATASQLAGTDAARQLAASQQLGALGTTAGGLTQQDLARSLQAGAGLGQLTQDQQTAALQRLGALEAAGSAQQQQTQRSLDLAYQDFLQQQEYDRQNIAFLNAALRGLEIPTQTTAERTGPASVYQPSPLSQVASAVGSIAGLRRLGLP